MCDQHSSGTPFLQSQPIDVSRVAKFSSSAVYVYVLRQTAVVWLLTLVPFNTQRYARGLYSKWSNTLLYHGCVLTTVRSSQFRYTILSAIRIFTTQLLKTTAYHTCSYDKLDSILDTSCITLGPVTRLSIPQLFQETFAFLCWLSAVRTHEAVLVKPRDQLTTVSVGRCHRRRHQARSSLGGRASLVRPCREVYYLSTAAAAAAAHCRRRYLRRGLRRCWIFVGNTGVEVKFVPREFFFVYSRGDGGPGSKAFKTFT